MPIVCSVNRLCWILLPVLIILVVPDLHSSSPACACRVVISAVVFDQLCNLLEAHGCFRYILLSGPNSVSDGEIKIANNCSRSDGVKNRFECLAGDGRN